MGKRILCQGSQGQDLDQGLNHDHQILRLYRNKREKKSFKQPNSMEYNLHLTLSKKVHQQPLCWVCFKVVCHQLLSILYYKQVNQPHLFQKNINHNLLSKKKRKETLSMNILKMPKIEKLWKKRMMKLKLKKKIIKNQSKRKLKEVILSHWSQMLQNLSWKIQIKQKLYLFRDTLRKI